jgi:hypothetical protein
LVVTGTLNARSRVSNLIAATTLIQQDLFPQLAVGRTILDLRCAVGFAVEALDCAPAYLF